MASGERMNPDSDDEVDLEALRLAALQSLHAKPKFKTHVNHSNLIPIVPVNVVVPIVQPTIKLEPISPTLEENIQFNSELESPTKDEEKDSLVTETDQENEEDILSMNDKEEEDSLERLMDQLEAEISGKAPIPSNRTVIAPKKSLNDLKGRRKGKSNKTKDNEVELVEVKIGKQKGPVINIRESLSPETANKISGTKNSPRRSASPKRTSRSPSKNRSRSPFRRSKSLNRSISPYWSKSPHRSRSARRSRSPFWLPRRSKSPFRKSRSQYRRSKSPLGRRSPYRYSRTRSRSFERRSRSPWSYSPRRRSRSPYFRDSFSPVHRRRLSPDNKLRKRNSLSPRGKSRSPRVRSRSPRRYLSGRRNSPFHRSKSPSRRSRSPFRNKSPFRRVKSPYGRSISPFARHTKSPINSNDSLAQKRRTPPLSGKPPLRRSKSLGRRSLSPDKKQRTPVKSPGGVSPSKRADTLRRSPRRSLSKSKRSRSYSASPRQKNRSPLRIVDKNRADDNEKLDNVSDRGRRPRSVSKERRGENYRRHDRRTYRSRGFRRFSPTRGKWNLDRQKKRSSRSPKKKVDDKERDNEKNQLEDKGTSPVPPAPVDPVLEARKKKFENLSEVDPTVDKKISLKSIKETTDTAPLLDEDDDALNINLESDLWEESEESENEHESRFKTGEAKVKTNRTVLSFRNLREDDSKKNILNKPLIDDSNHDKFNINRYDRWQRGRRNERSDRNHRKKYREDDSNKNKSENSNREKKFDVLKTKSQDKDLHLNKKSSRKIIVFSSPPRSETESKDNEVTTTSSVTNIHDTQMNKVFENFDGSSGIKDKQDKNKNDLRETDDFDKLISDFEKELESDICLPSKELPQTIISEQIETKRLRLSVKKDLFESQSNSSWKKPLSGSSLLGEIPSVKEKGNRFENFRRISDGKELGEVKEAEDKDQPEDYVEDDDFALEEHAKKRPKSRAEEDGQNDLRDILSRRRNERLTKVVSLQDSMPARLVQSAFQGLGNKKSKRFVKETQEAVELSPSDKNIKVTSVERRRVLLLQRKNPEVPSFKVTVPEVKPDTTIHQRLTRTEDRKRTRKLQKQIEAVDQEEQECFGAEEKQPRRVRLKRNVTLSSQH